MQLTGKVIEFGGGSNPQYHPNVDVRPGSGVDIVANLEEPLPIESDSYDAAWCQYALEHLSWRSVKNFIKEVYRILKPDGKFILTTANLKEQAKVLANSPKWEGDYESRLIFGDQDYADNSHKCGFSPEYAERLFSEVGFQVKVEPHPNCPTDMIIQAEKGVPVIDRFTWIKDKIKELNPETILDIGCADCPITYDLTNCTWVDTDPYEKIATDMRHFGREPIPQDKYYQTSAEDLPFENKSFDLALATELLEHVPDPVKVLNEIKRVARNVIITVPNEYVWSEELKPFTNPGHVRHYTEQMLKSHFKEAKINKYSLEKLEYEGWAFYTVVADLGLVSTVKKVELPKLGSDFYDGDYYKPGPKNDYSMPYTWENEAQRHLELANFITDVCHPKTLLDVGCAKGFAVKALLAKGVDSYGCDISEWAVGNCEPEVEGRLKVCDIRDGLPYPDNSFDTVFTDSTLEHVEKKYLDRVAKEIVRVSKEWIAVGVPFGKYEMKDPSHRTYEAEPFWSNLFTNAGCTKVQDASLISGLLLRKNTTLNVYNEIHNSAAHDKLKIALLSTPFLTVPPRNYGGLERIVADTAYCLAKLGHDVTIFCPEGSQVEGCKMEYFGPAIEKTDVNWLEAERNAANMVIDRIINNGYQLLHGHNWFGMEYAIKVRKPELKVLHTHHGGLNLDWWGSSKSPFCLNLIAISNWMQSVYLGQGFTSRVVYNGIPLEEYEYKAEKGDRLLFVGRLDSFKRPHIAIEVAKQVGLGLDIVGGSFVNDIPYMEQVKQACDGENIKLYLDASHTEKIALMQSAKAVIFSSLMGEPFGLITPEANACGTPVIGSRDGAIPEILQDGVSGFICDTVEEMVLAVKKVDSIKPEDCRKNAERFSREKSAESYLECYKSILSGGEW